MSAAIAIAEQRARFPDLQVSQVVATLKAGGAGLATLDYGRATEMAELAGWDCICAYGDRRSQLRETTLNAALRLRPFWMQASPWGRDRVRAVASDDQRQLLIAAGLFEATPCSTVLGFWDKLAAAERLTEAARNIELGREGERLTMEHEKHLLSLAGSDKIPRWIALEDNTAGYDVLSYRRNDCGLFEQRLIEVKASSFSPLHFFLSRAEWNCAELRRSEFILHLWNLETGKLREVSVDELHRHIPRDNGKGEWTRVRVVVDSDTHLEVTAE